MRISGKTLIASSLMLLCCIVFGKTERAFAFAEEPINFKDPRTHQVWEGNEISTVHFDMVYALAIAAGFSDALAAKISIWDQLVDSGRIGPDNRTVYTNCLGSTPPPPNPADPDVCPPDGYSGGKPIWPVSSKDVTSCTTSRYGAYAPTFHWPHKNWSELGQMKLWGWGEAKTLNGYGAYAWGDDKDTTVFTAKCRYQRPEVIDTGIRPGSLQAFSTYIHVLADSYSHFLCIQAADNMSVPWGNHTLLPGSDPTDCFYFPQYPHNGDTHGQEFGNGVRTGYTKDALVAVYNELVARSTKLEGTFMPLSLDEPLVYMEGQPTLRDAIKNFVDGWNFAHELSANPGEYAEYRRAYAGLVAAAAKSARKRRGLLQ